VSAEPRAPDGWRAPAKARTAAAAAAIRAMRASFMRLSCSVVCGRYAADDRERHI
jgi:hypothetical protein